MKVGGQKGLRKLSEMCECRCNGNERLSLLWSRGREVLCQNGDPLYQHWNCMCPAAKPCCWGGFLETPKPKASGCDREASLSQCSITKEGVVKIAP